MSGEHLDIASETPAAREPVEVSTKSFLGVHFTCCGVYRRIYPNADHSAYVGHCPKCTRPVRIGIAPGGSNERFFTMG